MKILLTGATGFIGSHLYPLLQGEGHDIVVAGRKQHQSLKRTEFIQFDLQKFKPDINYYELFGRPDLMIHLAWEGLPNYKEKFHVEKNLPAHLQFLKNLIENGLQNITITGTCLEYGMLEGGLNEEMPVDPVVPYAIAKHELHKALLAFTLNKNVRPKWLRLFYMYGPGQSEKSLYSQLKLAVERGDTAFRMSGGEQIRDFLPVERVCEYIYKLALKDSWEGTCNICSGKPVKVIDFVKELLNTWGKHIELLTGEYPYTDYEPMEFWGSAEKLTTLLNQR